MKKIIISVFIAFLPFVINAQKTTFTAKAPSVVGVGQRFEIQYTVKSPDDYADNFIAPSLGSNLQLISTSKSTGVSTSVSIINGSVSQSKTYTTTWSVIVEAKKTGTVSVQPAMAKVKDKTYKSNSVTIKISKDAPQKTQRQQSSSLFDQFFGFPQQQPQQQRTQTPSGNDIFLHLSVDKSTVYQGEPVYVSCTLYASPNYQLELQDFKLPAFDKFWVKEIQMPKSIHLESVLYNNRKYMSAVMDKRLLFPQSSGQLVVDPYNATFSLYDGWGFPIGDKKILSNKKTINIKPLPAGKPADFTGGVGQFKISVNVDNNNIEINNPVTVSVTVKGTGNFGLFDFPMPSMPKTFEELTPEDSENLSVTTNGIAGSKTRKYAYIARVPGDFTIPPVTFSYFDPVKEQYITVKSDTIKIHVTGDSSNVNNAYLKPSQYNEIAEDIRFINDKTILKPVNNFIFKSNASLCYTYLAILLVFLILTLFLRKKYKENADIQLVKFKNADKVSRKRLKKAKEYMQANKTDEFYQEITSALWGYVGDKMGIDASNLTRDNISEILEKHGVGEDLKKQLIELIDKAETARYAPTQISEDMQSIYQKAISLISDFEKNFVKIKNKAK